MIYYGSYFEDTDPIYRASDRELYEIWQDRRLQREIKDDEFGDRSPSMEDERRALAIGAELDRIAREAEPEEEDEIEMLRRLRIAAKETKQQGSLFDQEVA